MNGEKPLPEEVTHALRPQKKEMPLEGPGEVPNTVVFQEHDPWDDFIANIDANDERRPPTPEEREAMDRRLAGLAELFEGSGIRWQLDGALNISLMAGDYIGIHKDVDISVEADELAVLHEQLLKKGYGFFSSYSKDPNQPGTNVFERVGPPGALAAARTDHLLVAAVDASGNLVWNKALNFVDIHLVRRDAQGRPTSYQDVPLPVSWGEAVPVEYQGRELMTSHPAKVAYYKIHGGRNYDATDLHKLAQTGRLTPGDVEDIRAVVNEEHRRRAETSDQILHAVSAKMRHGMTAEELTATFMREMSGDQIKTGTEEGIRHLAQACVDRSFQSYQEFRQFCFDFAGFNALQREQEAKIETLSGWVEEAARR